MNKKKLITYIALTYGISWLIWLPNVLAKHFSVPWGHSDWLHVLGGLGPIIGALLTTLIFDGWKGLRQYFQERLFTFPKAKWLLVGFGMPIVFFLVGAVIFGAFTGEWVHLADLGLNSKIPFTNPLLIWLTWCFFYGLGEEGGWRGFLFPELARSIQPRMATLYVALIWVLWHLPIFFYDKDLSMMGWFGTLGWVVGLVFGSLLLGWLVKQSDFSLWAVILWHGTFNFFTASDRINPIYPGLVSTLVIVAALWIARRYGADLTGDQKKKQLEESSMG